MEQKIKEELEAFLAHRVNRFPNVSEEQKTQWVKNIQTTINNMLEDNDIFYDSKPEDVQALMHAKI